MGSAVDVSAPVVKARAHLTVKAAVVLFPVVEHVHKHTCISEHAVGIP